MGPGRGWRRVVAFYARARTYKGPGDHVCEAGGAIRPLTRRSAGRTLVV